MYTKFLGAGCVLVLSLGAANALTVTAVDGNADSGASLVNTLLGSSSGLTVTSTSFTGAAVQSGTFSDFGTTGITGLGDGIAMSSGYVAEVPNSNTDSSWDNGNLSLSSPEALTGGSSVEPDLTTLLENAGADLGNQDVNDVNILEFTFTVDDPEQNSVSAEFVYGTDEFPDQGVTDIFAFFVDGVNYAEFSDGSLINFDEDGPNAAFYQDNTGGAFGIEWDGLTEILEVTGLLNEGLTEHTIKIAIADTFDTAFDSAVYLSALSGGTTDGGGGIDIPDDDDMVMEHIPLPAGLPLLLGGLGLLGLAQRRTSA
ncbi:MAG: choice-of-anchor L domain-containing protein [Pseudomonadota bacterium]